MPCGTAYNCNNSSKNIPDKALFTLPNSECTRKANIPTLDQKEDTTVQSQHTNVNKLSAEHCSNVIVLLCTAKTEVLMSNGNKVWWEHCFRLIHTVNLTETDLGHP